MIVAIVIIIVVLVLLALYAIVSYNGLVSLRNRIENAWAQIDVQLKRRYDLIPNLVETVKGYAAHESGTLEAVTAARNSVATATTPEAKMEASGQLTNALRGLLAVAEAYPDLKANANFTQLQADLSDTENRISYARQSYNDMVLDYNNAIQTFPGNIVAGSKYKPRTGFTVEDPAARQAPQVKF